MRVCWSLIPGVFVFQMASAIAEAVAAGPAGSASLWASAAYNGGTAFMVTLAIATGLVLPKLFIEHYFPPDRRAGINADRSLLRG